MTISIVENYIDQQVAIELGSCDYLLGKIIEFDDFGVHFIELDNSAEMLIAWHDINKIILKPEEFLVLSPL